MTDAKIVAVGFSCNTGRMFDEFVKIGSGEWLIKTLSTSDYACDFWLYEVIGWSPDGSRSFRKRGDVTEMTEDTSEADCIHGFVKWDGCCELYFSKLTEGAFHMCGRNDVVAFGEALQLAFDACVKQIPKYQGSVGAT